jgi:chitin deacetylase
MSPVSSFLALALASVALGHPLFNDPGRAVRDSMWYHPPDHPVNKLFKRQAPGSLPAVGSPAWTAAYPAPWEIASQPLPAWMTVYQNAYAAGLIPNISVANTGPVYPGGQDPTGPAICSATFGCDTADDVLNAPDGQLALAFDDGPLEPQSQTLYDYLFQQNQRATHFMIGTNILEAPDLFVTAFQRNGDDVACHTWSHNYMTTLTDTQVVGELGWSLQIMHDSNGGRVSKIWRPPYGDVDNRVRAIAKYVFNLTTVIWNHDTEDWTMGSPGGATPESVAASLNTWLTGPKSPGLIILEHELSTDSVAAFIAAYPQMKSTGWNISAVPDALGISWYQNTANDNTTVLSMDVGGVIPTPTPTTTATPTANATSSTTQTAHDNKANGGYHVPVPPWLSLLGCTLLFFLGL